MREFTLLKITTKQTSNIFRGKICQAMKYQLLKCLLSVPLWIEITRTCILVECGLTMTVLVAHKILIRVFVHVYIVWPWPSCSKQFKAHTIANERIRPKSDSGFEICLKPIKIYVWIQTLSFHQTRIKAHYEIFRIMLA